MTSIINRVTYLNVAVFRLGFSVLLALAPYIVLGIMPNDFFAHEVDGNIVLHENRVICGAIAVLLYYGTWFVMSVYGYGRKRYEKYIIENSIESDLKRLGIFVLLVFSLHIASMVFFEHMPLSKAWWFAATTLLTVGYGDIYPVTDIGRMLTVVLNYLPGIAALGAFVGTWIDYTNLRRERKLNGEWRWNMSKMEKPIYILGSPDTHAEDFYITFAEELRRTDSEFAESPIVVVSPNITLSKKVNDHGIVTRNLRCDDQDDLAEAEIERAAAVIILAKEDNDHGSDNNTFATVDILRTMGVDVTIVAECVADNNRERIRRVGAFKEGDMRLALVRPMRAYPAMLVRTLVSTGSEEIIENIFTSSGDELVIYDLNVQALTYGELVCALMMSGAGTLLGYTDMNGVVHDNMKPDVDVQAKALFIWCREGNMPSVAEINGVLSDTRSRKMIAK